MTQNETQKKRQSLTPYMDEITVVFAHPDDELLYFYHTLQQLKPKRLRLVCVTGRFSDDPKSGISQSVRLNELANAAKQLGGELINLGLEDCRGGALDFTALLNGLKSLSLQPDMPVLTHGPLGEYGHHHHLQVFQAVMQCFVSRVWCLSGPLAPDYQCTLDEQSYQHKLALIRAIYPSQNIEGFGTERECLTYVFASTFGTALYAGCGGPLVELDESAALLEHIEQLYFSAHNPLPVEALGVAKVQGKANVQRRVRPLLQLWKDGLTPAFCAN
jgi:hypothetical protein